MTIGHIAGLLKELELKNVSTIFLVGGFGECKLVQEAMKKAVGRRTVIVSVVLKEAVMFSHQPRLISSRRLKYAYG